MSKELRECPFCGEDHAKIESHPQRFWAECHSCGTQGSTKLTKQEAIAAWNTRADGWQDAKTNPPELYKVVLVQGGTAMLRPRGWVTGMEEPMFECPILWEVTHWMDLPTPPEQPEGE